MAVSPLFFLPSAHGAIRRCYVLMAFVGVLSSSLLFAGDWDVNFHPTGEEAGPRFTHDRGATAEKYMPETMGAGGLFFDLDGDDWIDIFLVDSGRISSDLRVNRSALFRNRGDGTFTDVSERSGLRGVVMVWVHAPLTTTATVMSTCI